MSEIDATNCHMVAVSAENTIMLINPPRPGAIISKEQALTLAAWIVVLTNTSDDEFEKYQNAVMNT